ncbi:MAG: hypothetical protein WA885_24645 [Phormidesmis sp.]
MAEHIVSQAQFDETAFQWEHVDKLAAQFKCNLRPVLLSVEFSTSAAGAPLMSAIDFLKDAFQKGQSPCGRTISQCWSKRLCLREECGDEGVNGASARIPFKGS